MQESGDQIVLSYLNLNMGVAAKALGRYPQSQQHIDLAVTISEHLHNILGLGYALLSRGRLEISLEVPASHPDLTTSLDLFQQGRHRACQQGATISAWRIICRETDLAAQ